MFIVCNEHQTLVACSVKATKREREQREGRATTGAACEEEQNEAEATNRATISRLGKYCELQQQLTPRDIVWPSCLRQKLRPKLQLQARRRKHADCTDDAAAPKMSPKFSNMLPYDQLVRAKDR